MTESIYFKIFYVIASYLLGSVVFGYIIAKILKKEGFGKIDRPGTAGAGRHMVLRLLYLRLFSTVARALLFR